MGTGQRGYGQYRGMWGDDKDDDDPMYKMIDMFYKETGFLADEETPDWGLLILLLLVFTIPFAAFALVSMIS